MVVLNHPVTQDNVSGLLTLAQPNSLSEHWIGMEGTVLLLRLNFENLTLIGNSS